MGAIALASCSGSQGNVRPADVVQPNRNGDASEPVDDVQRSTDRDPRFNAGSNARDAWPFLPVEIRLHPLTHVVKSVGGQRTIEARLEFFDEQGHGTKGIGQVRFELVAPGYENTSASQTAEGVWDVDLTDLNRNARHYDSVTRTYLFRLSLDPSKQYQRTMMLKARVRTPQRVLHCKLQILIE